MLNDILFSSTAAQKLDQRPRFSARRPGSIRRSTTVTMYMPSGFAGPCELEGIGRDLVTLPAGGTEIVAADRMRAVIVRPYTVETLSTFPDWPELAALVGEASIAGYRGRLHALLKDITDRDRPLGMLLNDIAPCSLISGWVLTISPDSPLANFRSDPKRLERMAGVCAGYAPGSSAFAPSQDRAEPVQVGQVWDPADEDGWHEVAAERPFEMRRARRIDVWREGDLLMVESMFQDSALLDDGTRRAIHDYAVTAAFDANTGMLTAIEAAPRVLPNSFCPNAANGVKAMIGSTAAELSTKVLYELRGVAGCTHLNDAVRALAVVPWMGKALALAVAENPGRQA